MNKLYTAFLFALLTLQVSCASLQASKTDTTFFEAKPSIKIQTRDGIDKKEANMILEMYRILSIGDVTVYYSEPVSEKGKWVSRKKGHWGYRTMQFPILIDKKSGKLRHGAIQYSLRQLIESYSSR